MPTDHALELLAEFVDESTYLLQNLPELLDKFRRQPSNADPVHQVFRSVHSIKGNAGFFHLGPIKRFAHTIENVLDDLREARLACTPDLQTSLIRCFDLLEEMLRSCLEHPAGSPQLQSTADQLAAELTHTAKQAQPSVESPVDIIDRVRAAMLTALAGQNDSPEGELIRIPRDQLTAWLADLERAGIAPAKPQETGEQNTGLDSKLASRLDGEAIYICGEIEVTAQIKELIAYFSSKDQRRFKPENVQRTASLITELQELTQKHGPAAAASSIQQAATHLQTVLESSFDLDDCLLQIVSTELFAAFPLLEDTSGNRVLEESPVELPPTPSDAVSVPSPEPTRTSPRFVRVREAHLDSFAADVSELFLTCERFRDLQTRLNDESLAGTTLTELRQANVSLNEQVNALQDRISDLRTVPVRSLFGRIPSMARSLAGQLGKQLEVTVTGGENEIDKSLLEELDAPLTHIVRNVCDHAIEPTEERRSQGKPESGQLSLSCQMSKRQIDLIIEDDGRGIDPQRTRRKAVENGLLSREQAGRLSDEEAQQLIFQPGFSTAAEISDVSGRGVGMDVVRTVVEQHGGELCLHSVLGRGTTLTLKFPIRRCNLVHDALVVTEQGQLFAFPLESVDRVISTTNMERHAVQGQSAVWVGDNLARHAPLGQLLDLATAEQDSRFGLIIRGLNELTCVSVAQVVGLRKIVINPIPSSVPESALIAGVANFAKGRLALVLNPQEIASRLPNTPTAAAACC